MEKSFTYQTSAISYRMVGSGQPVVLLHGFGEDSHIWDEQIAFLKNHCMLIVPDIPGSGKSAMLMHKVSSHDSRFTTDDLPSHDSRFTTDDLPFTIHDYAVCINSLLLCENIGSCIMLGHSMGGYITLAFAEKYPEKLIAFGLINSTAFADSEGKKKTRLRAIETIEQYGAFPFLKTTIPSLFGSQFKQAHPEKIEQLILAGQSFTAEALQQYYRAMMNRPDYTDVLKNTSVPVLFVTATEDGPAPLDDVLQQSHMPYKSYIYILNQVGHMSMWEATDDLNKYLLIFINPL